MGSQSQRRRDFDEQACLSKSNGSGGARLSKERQRGEMTRTENEVQVA